MEIISTPQQIKMLLSDILICLYEDIGKPVENPALCIIAYFLERDGAISSVTMGENSVLNTESDGSYTTSTILFMANHFNEMLMRMNTPNSIEMLLASILKD